MAEQSPRKPLRYSYKFKFASGAEKLIDLELDPATLQVKQEPPDPKPEWTRLKFSQCENCPLSDDVEYCPVAVNLSTVVQTFQAFDSFEQVHVTVETKERSYSKHTSLQKSLSSIIGVYMVTSNCPIMDKLRPMSQFHLPFATSMETFYRSVSMYLTAQFFLMRQGKEPDWDLKKLVELYKAISTVNKGIAERLRQASEKDANVNAVVILHSFGDGVPYFVEGGLAEIEHLFTVYTNYKGEDGVKEQEKKS
ncbi:MAG: DUF6901 family protein [Bacteroidota bacterium]